MRHLLPTLLVLCLLTPTLADAKHKSEKPAEEAKTEDRFNAETFSGLKLRSLGPALTSGRVSDIAVHPEDHATIYVTMASGGVWKTTNGGTTWAPIFDGEGSYSIGCVTLDPNNPHVVWVGTGENNSQRSVGYGDGVYKSLDGGGSWQKVGLETSEHIGKIVVDPRDSDVVYVAAQGPLWSSGGDRGLYKTSDGGATWNAVLEISENTGVSDLVMDPRDPDVLYAAAYQRRRRVWTLVNGGPESGLHKSTDGGETWRELEGGLPSGDVGRIGLAIAPADPDVIYAVVEAALEDGGFYRSADRGETWEKRGDYVSASPQYYQELVPDPHDVDRVYSMDTWLHVTEDGGATFDLVPETYKHVDNHAMWIDPGDTDHLLTGCDGGLYETWDRGATWHFFGNLPATQFYKIAVDDAEPFYNVYGGTQDNFTLGGPVRTRAGYGIGNSDWFVTVGGDGFQPRIEPGNPDIVYSQWQYGHLVRHDRKSGEIIDIQPQPEADDAPVRWNWDAPLIISPHSKTRLYYAAQRIYRSDDRGDTWKPVSGDLTRQIDRNELEVMGKVWSVDAVAKNRSTSPYGNIVSLSESPLVEGLIYAGTDDGLIQVTEDGGGSWRTTESFAGVPEMGYVGDVEASRHDADTVYAAFNLHKNGDFKPYVLMSADRGTTWSSIAGDPDDAGLPERGSVYALDEDHEQAGLLFAGTELGAFFSHEKGRWAQLKGGVPTVAVRDLAVQRRENDLVLGTFGRGFYVLDDYTPLRGMTSERLEAEAILFPVKNPLMYMEAYPLGMRANPFVGDDHYFAPNPPFGAVFTYYLKEGMKTLAEQRREAEKEAEEGGGSVSYPSWDALRAEDREETPVIVLTVSDSDGHVIRRLEGPTGAGFHRVAWDLRFASPDPASVTPVVPGAFDDPVIGPMAVPGTYTVALARRAGGETTPLGEPQTFQASALGLGTLAAEDKQALLDFQHRTARLQRAVLGAGQALGEAQGRVAHLKVALRDTPDAGPELGDRLRAVETKLADLSVDLFGDRTRRARAEPTLPSITQRVDRVVSGHWTSTSAPTATLSREYDIGAQAFGPLLDQLRELIGVELKAIEDEVEAAGGPWTPGRLPVWER
ncbi:MAG: glycosyl hydrolase [bacterium]|nr:glycosyl hydrolase [bacterium]